MSTLAGFTRRAASKPFRVADDIIGSTGSPVIDALYGSSKKAFGMFGSIAMAGFGNLKTPTNKSPKEDPVETLQDVDDGIEKLVEEQKETNKLLEFLIGDIKKDNREEMEEGKGRGLKKLSGGLLGALGSLFKNIFGPSGLFMGALAAFLAGKAMKDFIEKIIKPKPNNNNNNNNNTTRTGGSDDNNKPKGGDLDPNNTNDTSEGKSRTNTISETDNSSIRAGRFLPAVVATGAVGGLGIAMAAASDLLNGMLDTVGIGTASKDILVTSEKAADYIKAGTGLGTGAKIAAYTAKAAPIGGLADLIEYISIQFIPEGEEKDKLEENLFGRIKTSGIVGGLAALGTGVALAGSLPILSILAVAGAAGAGAYTLSSSSLGLFELLKSIVDTDTSMPSSYNSAGLRRGQRRSNSEKALNDIMKDTDMPISESLMFMDNNPNKFSLIGEYIDKRENKSGNALEGVVPIPINQSQSVQPSVSNVDNSTTIINGSTQEQTPRKLETMNSQAIQ